MLVPSFKTVSFHVYRLRASDLCTVQKHIKKCMYFLFAFISYIMLKCTSASASIIVYADVYSHEFPMFLSSIQVWVAFGYCKYAFSFVFIPGMQDKLLIG